MNLLLRISEVLDLRVGDVDLSSKKVNVRIFKTGDIDSMPMMFELEQELRRHLIWLTTQVGELKPDYHLVPGTNGHGKFVPTKPARRPADIIKKGLTRIGWEDVRGEGGHTLRRTGARLLLMRLEDEGIDRAMRIVHHMLHHKNMAQTEHYLGLRQIGTETECSRGCASTQKTKTSSPFGKRRKHMAKITSLAACDKCGVHEDDIPIKEWSARRGSTHYLGELLRRLLPKTSPAVQAAHPRWWTARYCGNQT